MALSNKFGALVLTTGNKSEMAVGYCTLYGDMCGALAVIADVFKNGHLQTGALAESGANYHPRSVHHQTAERGAAAQPDGPGFAATLRNAGPDLDAYVVKNLGKEEIIQQGF